MALTRLTVDVYFEGGLRKPTFTFEKLEPMYIWPSCFGKETINPLSKWLSINFLLIGFSSTIVHPNKAVMKILVGEGMFSYWHLNELLYDIHTHCVTVCTVLMAI